MQAPVPATNTSDRVPLADVRDLLKVGEPLPFRVLDALERLLLNAGQVLADEAQFAGLIERGAWAERHLVEAERATRAAGGGARAPQALSLFDRWERTLWQFDKLSRALVRRQAKGAEVSALFATLCELVDVDADVALFLCVRQDDRRFALYPLTHALHCAVLVLLTGRYLGWSQARVGALGCSALTMNLAILELQATMAEQDDPPTPRQLKDIRAHPQASVKLLQDAGVVDEAWLAAIAEHHEQPGGGGYPHDLTEVCEAAQLLRAADVLMAKISPRARRPAMAPQAAVRALFQQRPGDPLAMALIRTLGVYPPGSLLKLRSGEVAVAIRRPAAGTHPLVATLSDTNGRPSAQTHRRDSAQPEFNVLGALVDAPGFARVLPERVYGIVGA
ncbi:MAG TPA: HD domain-containing phosphohydrolase [Burkholderiaceae bacterium]|nr:HD domain-containing phosphohydrolase [Burkholderiaceae bacterium]